MKYLSFLIFLIIQTIISNGQNVGVGTTTPESLFSVGPNSQFQVDASGDIKKINNVPYSFPAVQGNNGQLLSNNGNGSLKWVDAGSIYTLNSSNYSSISIPDNNFVKIEGTITLTGDYIGLNNQNLIVTGGTITGNGSYVFKGGDYTLFNGVTFSNVDIDCYNSTFINCNFTGNCPRLGYDNRFNNCNFSGLTTTSIALIGTVESSELSNSVIPRVREIINSEVNNCTIGGSINAIINCRVDNSTINALSDLTFSNNKCDESKINIGSSTGSPRYVTVSNNLFDGLLSGTNGAIEIDPSNSFVKIFNIQNNIFHLQSTDPQGIIITLNDGNSAKYSVLNIQGNSFYNGLGTLSYSSDIKIVYSQNVASRTTHPSATGNLNVNNNYTY